MAKADLNNLLSEFKQLIVVLDNPNNIAHVDILSQVQNVLRRCICFKQNQLIIELKSHLESYASKHFDSKPYNIPYHLFKIVSSHPHIFSEEELDQYIGRCEASLDELYNDEMASTKSLQSNIFEMGELLLTYYKNTNSQEKVDAVFRKLLECMDAKKEHMPAFRQVIILHKFAVMARKLQSKRYEDAFNNRIQVISPDIKKEMQHQRLEFEFPITEMDEIFDSIFCTGDPGFNFFMMGISFIPDECQIEMISKHLPKNEETLKHFTRINFNSNGNIASISTARQNGNAPYDIEGYRQITELSSMFLHYVIEKGITTGKINENDILNYLSISPIITPMRLIIVQQGVNAFFLKEYITSISILLPQIEYMIGEMYRILGHTITNSNENGTQVDGLGEILKKDSIILGGKNISFYLQATLTHQSGWNLRNLFCHGQSTAFNFINAERIFQILILIAGIRYKKIPLNQT